MVVFMVTKSGELCNHTCQLDRGACLAVTSVTTACPPLTSHLDVQWIQARRVHLHYHLVGVVDDGEAGVLREAQYVIVPIRINHPGGHDGPARDCGVELPFLRAAAPPDQRVRTRWATEAKQPHSE